MSKLNPNEVDVQVQLIKELPPVTCQHVSWPPIKVQVCLRWPSLAPSQGRHNRGREVLPYCCQSRSSTEHMKGMHSRFYGPGWLHKPLLCGEFMYPIARINNASLIRDPRNQDPWREGGWEKKKSSAMCAVSVPRSSANHHPQEHFYWKEFISQLYQRCPSVYFPARGDCWGSCRSGSLHTGERLCYRQAAVFKDTQVTAFMNFHWCAYCFHQLFYLHSSTYFSF